MQMKQLEYIVKIAECGSISKAAQLLFVSQPSLTKSVMQLEQEYGIQILIRKARGVELTPEGKSFIHYARGVLTAARVLESTFSHQKHLTDTKKSRLFLASQQLDFVYDLMLKTYQLNRSKRIHYNLVETDRNAVTGLLLSGGRGSGPVCAQRFGCKNLPLAYRGQAAESVCHRQGGGLRLHWAKVSLL